jgi:hypothetical protein
LNSFLGFGMEKALLVKEGLLSGAEFSGLIST